jgi:hypothetical protein
MEYMFEQCMLLNNLDLSNFKPKKGINVNMMFEKCYSLKEKPKLTYYWP